MQKKRRKACRMYYVRRKKRYCPLVRFAFNWVGRKRRRKFRNVRWCARGDKPLRPARLLCTDRRGAIASWSLEDRAVRRTNATRSLVYELVYPYRSHDRAGSCDVWRMPEFWAALVSWEAKTKKSSKKLFQNKPVKICCSEKKKRIKDKSFPGRLGGASEIARPRRAARWLRNAVESRPTSRLLSRPRAAATAAVSVPLLLVLLPRAPCDADSPSQGRSLGLDTALGLLQ